MKKLSEKFLGGVIVAGLVMLAGCATSGSASGSTAAPAAAAVTQATFPLSAAEGMQWDGWDANPTTAYANPGGNDGPKGVASYTILTTAPKSWGWGIVAQMSSVVNLSEFSQGHITFWLRSTYPGKLLVGFGTGTSDAGDNGFAYTELASGDAGFVNDGNWHQVTLAISALKFWHKDGAQAPQVPDLTRVSAPFFTADVFASGGGYRGTRDTQDATNGQQIDVAGIEWTRS